MIAVCPKCGGELDLPPEVIGNKLCCPYCEKKFWAEVVLRDLIPAASQEKRCREKKSAPQLLRNLFVATSGREYEECIHAGIEEAGYNCILTPQSCDQGVDVVVKVGEHSIAIQCKLYSSPIGNDAVQEVVAGAKYYKCDNACVVTNSSFTAAAQSLAAANGVALLHHRDLLAYLGKFNDGSAISMDELDDFEVSTTYQDLVLRAEQGDAEARARIGDYYYTQLVRFALIDLRRASEYFTLATHVGEPKTLQAYDDFINDCCDDAEVDVFGRIFDEMTLGTYKLPEDYYRELEYDWFCACRDEYLASREPAGRRKDSMLMGIPFGKRHWKELGSNPKVTYYLGVCKARGLGCPADEAVGIAIIARAAEDGHLEARRLIESLPPDTKERLIEKGLSKLEEKKRNAERLEQAQR